jgi:hypothetical protein
MGLLSSVKDETVVSNDTIVAMEGLGDGEGRHDDVRADERSVKLLGGTDEAARSVRTRHGQDTHRHSRCEH